MNGFGTKLKINIVMLPDFVVVNPALAQQQLLALH